MMIDPKEQLRARAAAEIAAQSQLEVDPAPLLATAADAAAFVEALLARGAAMDAVRFLCHALAPRQAVWLAWDVAQSVAPASARQQVLDALAATSAWLVEPTDEHRRAAQAAADACGFDDPAGCAALAVFLAEGSLGPEDLPEPVPPPPGACAKAATGALLLAAVRDPLHADERAARFVRRWFELAAEPAPWDPTQAASPGTPPAGGGGYDTDMKF